MIEEIKLLEDDLGRDNIVILENKKHELFELRQQKLEGMIVRSKAKWINDGERNSKYFCGLEKRHFTEKSMPFLEKFDGSIIHDADLITQELRKKFL